MARFIANVCRRSVSAEEKSQMLGELGETYVKAGVKPGPEPARLATEFFQLEVFMGEPSERF